MGSYERPNPLQETCRGLARSLPHARDVPERGMPVARSLPHARYVPRVGTILATRERALPFLGVGSMGVLDRHGVGVV